MEVTRPAPLTGAASENAQLAKAALRRLAIDKLEPTPENYARAWRQESGEPPLPAGLPERAHRVVERVAARAFEADAAGGGTAGVEFMQAVGQGRWEQAERTLQNVPAADGAGIASLIERIVRGIERGTKGWTSARKKESLQRVLASSRSDARRLQQRLTQLVASWDAEPEEGEASVDEAAAVTGFGSTASVPIDALPMAADAVPNADFSVTSLASAPVAPSVAPSVAQPPWGRAVTTLGATVQSALPRGGALRDSPSQNPIPDAIAVELGLLTERIDREGASPELVDQLEALCHRAAPVLQHRHHLLDQLGQLCRQLTASLTDLAENDSWAKGQCEAMQVKIDEGLSLRGVRAVSELLRDTRERQGQLRSERERARDSLKGLINRMLTELDQLGSQTGNFHESVGRYADVIEKADSLESLAGVVREMVEESRTVQALVQQTQERLQAEHSKATGLTERVNELESEMRRLSDEVSTDQLTQIANRRGLLQAFEAEQARQERAASTLAVGLLDIDNFKRLNDELGHGAGDEALKSLAAIVSKTLRPTDSVARYGGEEFVVLLPETAVDEGQQILTRLQRSLTGGLFMHESKQVFVTFSAGITAYRAGERLEEALERADQALYEAKRTGKNRTCLG
jgi:diguanylate cyclase